ncbi:hypothetical protein SDC9_170197 [bioreactor metagenome]|uniref:Uncharacterized protein n=1 Tax=bioreactor metagenome TaxID=1076179 RepID=A0A645GGE4_9ZZZZ
MAVRVDISHLPEDNVQPIIDALKQLLPNTKIRITKGFKPYKHIYIIPKNDTKTSKNKGFA